MKILTNKDIKTLFKTILLCVLMFLFVSITILSIAKEHAAVCILINALIMAGASRSSYSVLPLFHKTGQIV